MIKTKRIGNTYGNDEEYQEKLTQETYVHHNHGGQDHGHDWDDALKNEREFGWQHERKKKSRELRRQAKEVARSAGLK